MSRGGERAKKCAGEEKSPVESDKGNIGQGPIIRDSVPNRIMSDTDEFESLKSESLKVAGSKVDITVPSTSIADRRVSDVSSIASFHAAMATSSPRIVIQQSSLEVDDEPDPGGGGRKVVETPTYRLSYPAKYDFEKSLNRTSSHRLHQARRSVFTASSSAASRSGSEGGRKKTTRKKAKKKKARKLKKKKKWDNIDIDGVTFNVKTGGGGVESDASSDLLFEPPAGLSPRSKAEFARIALKKSAEKRRKKKRLKDGGEKDKKRRQRRRRRKRKRKKKSKRSDEDQDEEDDYDDLDDEELKKKRKRRSEHFYPPPKSMRRKRCQAYQSEDIPIECSICDGVHYRTKRNFASNIRILMNVNKALSGVLVDMSKRMKKINYNINRVKMNLEYLEEMYEGVFRRVNRLILQYPL